MGFSHGTCKKFDELFEKHFDCSIEDRNLDSFLIELGYVDYRVSEVCGDCTAATLYTSEGAFDEDFQKHILIVLKWLSYNGVINVYFSRCGLDVKEEIDFWKSLKATGLCIQQSNRSSGKLLSGLIKITNPFVQYTYDSLHPDMPCQGSVEALIASFTEHDIFAPNPTLTYL
jgi:hypothetical protein